MKIAPVIACLTVLRERVDRLWMGRVSIFQDFRIIPFRSEIKCHSYISIDIRKLFLGTKTFPFGLQKTSTSIDEEDEVAIKLMHEEDLSFQLLQDADTVHKYVFKKIK